MVPKKPRFRLQVQANPSSFAAISLTQSEPLQSKRVVLDIGSKNEWKPKLIHQRAINAPAADYPLGNQQVMDDDDIVRCFVCVCVCVYCFDSIQRQRSMFLMLLLLLLLLLLLCGAGQPIGSTRGWRPCATPWCAATARCCRRRPNWRRTSRPSPSTASNSNRSRASSATATSAVPSA